MFGRDLPTTGLNGYISYVSYVSFPCLVDRGFTYHQRMGGGGGGGIARTILLIIYIIRNADKSLNASLNHSISLECIVSSL